MHIFDISIFGIQIAPTWYGLMYALGFILCYTYINIYWYLRWKDIDSLLIFIFIGVILWWRLGYVILYDFSYFVAHPLEIGAIWKGGMSFHGGALGVIIGMVAFSKMKGYRLFDISDPLVSILPIALGLGRIGNYINGELLGFSPYEWPWKIVEKWISHFPSTLLEAFLEGIVLLMIMQWARIYEQKNGRSPWRASLIFLWGYGVFRIFAEFLRLPDVHIGYLFWTDWVTLGMLYTLPMIIGAGIIWFMRRAKAQL